MGSRSGGGGEEENVTLTTKGKKANKGSFSGAKKEKGKHKENEKDMSKVKCFACGKIGHYVVQCPNKKNKKNHRAVASVEVDEFTSIFDTELALLEKVD